MAAAVLLTAVAMLGIAGGVIFHRGISNYWAAAGGLLLLAIAFVWIAPEIASAWSWPLTLLAIGLVVVVLALADAALVHLGHSPYHGVIAPLLTATAIHSLLDGWSIRALASQPVPLVLVPIGLGLHKLPEGFALGWVLRRTLPSHTRAFAFGALAELFTIVGALLEPAANRVGLERFGSAWTPAVLCVIGGAFVFLACHALLPYFKHHHFN